MLLALAAPHAAAPARVLCLSRCTFRKHSAIFCTLASPCDRTHFSATASNSSVPCSTGRCFRSHTYCNSIPRNTSASFVARKALAFTANRTASHTRSCGMRWQESAYPKLQLCNSSGCKRAPSCPGAVQCPLHPHPSGRRAGCGHAPFSNFSVGMKKGQAMNAVASDEWPAKSLQYYGTGNCSHSTDAPPLECNRKGEFVVTSYSPITDH